MPFTFGASTEACSSIFAIIIYVICKLSTFTISLFSLKGKRCRGSTCFFFRYNCFTSNAICFFVSIFQFLNLSSGFMVRAQLRYCFVISFFSSSIRRRTFSSLLFTRPRIDFRIWNSEFLNSDKNKVKNIQNRIN